MGCSSSLQSGSARSLPAIVKTVPIIALSAETKNTLKESWKLVEPVKTDAGKVMFVR